MNGNVADDDFNDEESDKWWNSLKFIIVNKWNASSKRWLEKKWKVIHMQRRWANVKTNAVAVAGPNPQIMCHFMQMESKEAPTKNDLPLDSSFLRPRRCFWFPRIGFTMMRHDGGLAQRVVRRQESLLWRLWFDQLPPLNYILFDRLSSLNSCFDSTKFYPKFDGNYEESILGTRSKLAREKWSKTGSKKEYFLKK